MPKLVNKIISVNKRRTSMRLCTLEWDALKEICDKENITRNKLIEKIEADKSAGLGLSYSTRLFLLQYYRNHASGRVRRSPVPHQNIISTLQTISKL